jgi:hypothetical protein
MFFSWFLYFYFFPVQTQTHDRSCIRAPGEEEEPPGAGDYDSRRDFTNRQMYKRVWVSGHNMVMMVGETTWAPLTEAVGDGSLRRLAAGPSCRSSRQEPYG